MTRAARSGGEGGGVDGLAGGVSSWWGLECRGHDESGTRGALRGGERLGR